MQKIKKRSMFRAVCKKGVVLLLVCGLLFSFTACNSKKIKQEEGVSGYRYVFPETISGALHNPGTGWISLEEPTSVGRITKDFYGDMPLVDNIGVQTCWGLIEKEKGVFDWSGIDDLIYYWTGKGKKINFRICTDNLMLPSVYNGVPNWLIDEMVEKYGVEASYETYDYSYSGALVNQILAMNLANEYYLERFDIFMDALSKRYAGNPDLATIDIRGFGCWSEWHSGYTFDSMADRIAALSNIVKKYSDSFTAHNQTLFFNCPAEYRDSENGAGYKGEGISLVNPSDYADYLKWSAYDYGFTLPNTGYRLDGCGTSEVNNRRLNQKLMTEAYRSGKLTSNAGEFINGVDYHVIAGGIYGKKGVDGIDELMFKMHVNYATVCGWTNPAVAQLYREGYEDFLQRGADLMGYRFTVDQMVFPEKVTPSGEMQLALTVSNKGTGKFYLDGYGVKYALIDGRGKEAFTYIDYGADLNNILAGSSLTMYNAVQLPSDLPQGDYRLRLSIVNEAGINAVRFASAGDYDAKTYDMGVVTVAKKAKNKQLFQKLSYGDLTSYKFKKDTAYRVTFDYRSDITCADYVFDSLDKGFVVKLGSRELATWQDISGDEGSKSVVFAVTDGDGNLTVENKDFADIEVTAAYVEVLSKGKSETFTDYDFFSSSSAFYSEYENFVSCVDNRAALQTSSIGMNDLLVTDANLLQLESGVTYSVSFDFQALEHSATAGYQYLKLITDSGERMLGEWYMRPDEPKTRMDFTFTVDGGNAQLAFGLKNSGGYAVDNVYICALSKGSVLEGNDHVDPENVEWTKPTDNLGKVETFESGQVIKSLASYGASYLGSLTVDPDEVIEGKYSYKGSVPIELYGKLSYYEIMYSSASCYGAYDAYRLKAYGTYRVQFDYRVTELPYYNGNYGHFLAFFRSTTDDTGYTFDRMVNPSFGNRPENLGKVMHFDETVTLGGKSDYVFMLSMYMPGKIIVDNFVISEVAA